MAHISAFRIPNNELWLCSLRFCVRQAFLDSCFLSNTKQNRSEPCFEERVLDHPAYFPEMMLRWAKVLLCGQTQPSLCILAPATRQGHTYNELCYGIPLFRFRENRAGFLARIERH